MFISSDAPFVDVDYMVITSGDGNAQTQSADVWLDDGAHNITYSDGWQTSPNGFQTEYYMNTMHRTDVNGASATLLFNGNAITVYGATSTDHGLFSVSLDDSDSPLLLNGVAPAFRPQNILYYAGGLSNDSHNLTLMNADPSEAWFDLDKFVVSTWPALSVNVSMTQASTSITGSTADISKPTTSNMPNTNQRYNPPQSICLLA
ncbi:hypothetical protein PHLCEN_2v6326 [Hermanssonia centrifuga]|uniref:Lectin n=1 Tax=Hermanssonia centrifuga TaxID=98765 RepID=A0A2R6NZP8_9APHY|nr:hypothetical protein PHLCEN_2v6326 [Hermanssonia centrifuga]